MTFDAAVTLVVVLASVALLVRDVVTPVAAVLGATILLLVIGVIDASQAFAGFSNPAPITVAALYVLARAVESTGALEPVINAVMGRPDADRLRRSSWARRLHLGRVIIPSGLASAFLNNTPIVAMVAPQIADWSNQRGMSASPLLMPLSFAAILGGMVTVIGTSTNLVVSGLLEQAGEPPIGMFEITRIGLPLALAGLVIILLLAHRVMPDRVPAFDRLEQRTREFSVAMHVCPGGPLEGRSISDAGLRDLQGVYLAQIERADRITVPVAPTETLRGGDVLTFVGRVDTLLILADEKFRVRWRDAADFLLIARLGGSPPAMTRKAPLVAVIGFLLVFVAGAGLVPILNAALVAALALVVTGVLTPGEARSAVDLSIVVLIAAAFGLGEAVATSGLADIPR